MATDGAQDSGLAGRYATALLELAQQDRSVEKVEQELASLKAAINASADLARLVQSPVFTNAERGKALSAVLDKMGVSTLTKNFVLVLNEKRRMFALLDIIRAFDAMVARNRGEVQATVTSARALGDAEMTELRAILKSKLGREPRIETKVDPSLLGGLIVKVGSRMIDSSLRTKLNGIRTAMRGN